MEWVVYGPEQEEKATEVHGSPNGKRLATLKEIYNANNSGFLLTWEVSAAAE